MSSKSILNKKSMRFLEEYLNNPSPTGYEWEGQKIWMNYLKPYVDEFITDTYGTAVAVINPNHKYKVVIEGHSDEISWYVNYISEKGLISVIRNGGSDHQIAPSKIVNIHTDKGIVKGVFGWPAIHTRKASKEETPKLDNIFIDVGCKNKKDVEKLGVHVGCVITYPDPFHILNKDNFVCRALDNRIGGFMIAEVARLLKENKKKLPFGLYVTNSVQEEVGLKIYDIEYVANQPWPFPSSLMFGLKGNTNQTLLDIDKNELEDAVWLTREELKNLLKGNCDNMLPARPGTIARHLLESWVRNEI